MPTKQSSQPRNFTGIYLGLEGNVNPPKQRSGIPPLVRPRGTQSFKVRTPVEERRYAPALYHEKKQMVELIRIKEEKRGFVGQPLKKSEVNNNKRPVTTSPTASPRRWGPARRTNSLKFNERIRTNPRNFTPILNSGVTRSENLTGFASYSLSNPDIRQVHIDDISGDFSKLGVVPDNISTVGDQYNRLYEVCDVESDIGYNLLPRRTPPPSRCHGNNSYTTGFSISREDIVQSHISNN
ncbi:hypothetical protein LOTGIDRAFT_157047 [Lottia gigantea]|uniref:Uncharacterized protein n=1 Tax=Lottia gigantea TaxID=225164 RepID=V4CLB8_LOTGI|nr:hypothetical protein LOTGIDRAFT_157047 [Lottia gigantea]ESP03085.1 hypothetical protein LOTGIDRAFT_157047 [Lottia gigantea]